MTMARDLHDEYDSLYCRVEDERRVEWEAEFGCDNPRFPFAPNGPSIHAETELRLALVFEI